MQQNEAKNWSWTTEIEYILGKEAKEEATEQQQGYDNEKMWYSFKDKIDVQRNIHKRIYSYRKFEWYQHKDYYSYPHTTHWDEDRGNQFIQIRDPSNFWWNFGLHWNTSFITSQFTNVEEIKLYTQEYKQNGRIWRM